MLRITWRGFSAWMMELYTGKLFLYPWMSGIFVFICSYGNTLPSALLMHGSAFSSVCDLLKCEYPQIFLGTLWLLKPLKSEMVSSFSFLMEKKAFTFSYSFAFSECSYFHEEQGFAWSEWKKCRERKCVCLRGRLRECAYH